MKDWALLDDYPVGRSPDWHSIGLNQALEREPKSGDIIALAPRVGDPLRAGVARVLAAVRVGTGGGWRLEFRDAVTDSIPTATGYDAVYVATAIGESAFDRPEAQ